MIKKSILSVTLFCFFISCKETNENKVVSNENVPVVLTENEEYALLVKNILEKQLKQGAHQFIDEAGVEIPKDKFETQDLEATVKIVNNILSSNGFKKLSNQEFGDIVKKIFNRVINFESENKYLSVNYMDKCNKDFSNNPNKLDFYGTYIIKSENFITDFYYIPEILNYRKEFPEISKIEGKVSKNYKKDGNSYTIWLWKEAETDVNRYYL